MGKIGITERGDAGLDFSWASRLNEVDFAILISKNLNDKLVAGCIAHMGKVILHLTVTGYGATIVEPNVPTMEYNREQIEVLKRYGFPINQVVLRLDPIIPTSKGIAKAEAVLELFKDSGITRCRYSFVDEYNHVKERYSGAGINCAYGGFEPSEVMIINTLKMLEHYREIYEFEACAENTPDKLACISQKDTLVMQSGTTLIGSAFQRGRCGCPSNKLELLDSQQQCPHGCLYCYWK